MGSCKEALIRGCPNGATHPDLSGYPCKWRRTRGTETSKYPEEEKTTVISQVVASEREVAQTIFGLAGGGVVGPQYPRQSEVEAAWKAAPQRVKAP